MIILIDSAARSAAATRLPCRFERTPDQSVVICAMEPIAAITIERLCAEAPPAAARPRAGPSARTDASDCILYGVVILNVSNTLVVAVVPLSRLATMALP